MRKAAIALVAIAGSLVFGMTGAFGGSDAVPGVGHASNAWRGKNTLF